MKKLYPSLFFLRNGYLHRVEDSLEYKTLDGYLCIKMMFLNLPVFLLQNIADHIKKKSYIGFINMERNQMNRNALITH